MNRLRRPKTAVRWRLTLLYGGLFLACGAALLAVTYGLVSHAPVSTDPGGLFAKGGDRKPVPFSTPDKQALIPSETLPSGVRRVLESPAGRATVKLVGARQRIADLHRLEAESAIALAIMALISGGLGWLVAGRVLRPLERAYDAQRRFVANASHELRTPLTASRALLEMVITDPQATRETFRQTCRDALEENEQQEELIDALLALAEGDQEIVCREPVDLSVVVSDALREHQAGAEQLDLDVELIPAVVLGDRRLLVRLVSNLIQNAIRHNIPDGYVRVRIAYRDGGPVLRIANSGPVVPAAEIDRLLAPFQRLAPDRVGHPSGFGLGLSIVAAVAAAHDAALEITPGEDGGLSVEVGFPRAGRGGTALKSAELPEHTQGEFVSQLR
ncbi:MAG TPA: HAMP domain-containing sensor histidine kinase [Solirubrobacteraceae bacterium]|nr:HAMP domain-containing sensor histidine kinase [Solirubrobacteraceae bacterium]